LLIILARYNKNKDFYLKLTFYVAVQKEKVTKGNPAASDVFSME
jgi:hypothetical protein